MMQPEQTAMLLDRFIGRVEEARKPFEMDEEVFNLWKGLNDAWFGYLGTLSVDQAEALGTLPEADELQGAINALENYALGIKS